MSRKTFRIRRHRDRSSIVCALGALVSLAWFTVACWMGATFTPETDDLTRVFTSIMGAAGFVGCLGFFSAGLSL